MGRESSPSIDIKLAMDNLAAIMGLEAGPLVIVLPGRIITDEAEIEKDMTPWLSAEGPEPVLEVLDATYHAIHQHLVHLYKEGGGPGIASLMALVGESAKRIEEYLVFKLGRPLEQHVGEREELQELVHYYTHVYAPKFEKTTSDGAFKDFASVQADTDYELFYVRNEDGKPYFNRELVRSLRLGCDFDLSEMEEDPILQVRSMVDKDLHSSAAQILHDCHGLVSDFFKAASHLEDNELSKSLSMAISALLLSTNSKNLIQNAAPKSSLQYFIDFQYFLRRAMHTMEYQKLLAYPGEGDKVEKLLFTLTHALCKSIFMRVGGVKQESIALIHRSMRRGEEIKKKKADHLLRGSDVWNQFLLDDEKYRTLLAKFPNGPLFKVLDLIREETDEDTIIPFDPIGQENIPARLYEIERKGKKIDVLRMAAPVRQSHINKVEIVEEFRGFLRALGSEKKKHLLINLSDRTSWKEYTRSHALEQLQLNAEFSHELFVITLPKDTDFYHQSQEYLNVNKADEFIDIFFNQMKTPQECGYFFPPQIKQTDLIQFTEEALSAIHTYFFEGKETLSRREREDFIEIFYQFLVLKCIDLLEPTSVSFTCKDAIDTGMASAAMFYGFVKLINGDFSKKEEQDFLRWLLYTPALFIRERAVNPERCNRAFAALEQIDLAMSEEGKAIVKTFGDLYQPKVLQTLNVSHH